MELLEGLDVLHLDRDRVTGLYHSLELSLFNTAEHRGLASGGAAFGLKFLGEKNRPGLKHGLTEQHPRSNRIARVVTGIERLIGAKRAGTGGPIGPDLVDPVQEEKRGAMRDGVENGLQHGSIFAPRKTDKRHENSAGLICFLSGDAHATGHEDPLRHPPHVPPPLLW